MKQRNRGQALVEFVLILPVLIMMLFGIVDFGRVLYEKNHLETVIGEVSSLVETKKYSKDKVEEVLKLSSEGIQLEFKVDDNGLLRLTVKKALSLYTPGSQIFFQNPYPIESSRVIIHE